MRSKIFALLILFLSNLTGLFSQVDDQPLGKGLLWEISGNGMKKKSYLLGTIHIISTKDYFFPKYYTKALKQSDYLVMEVDVTDVLAQLEVMAMAVMKDKELKDFYDEATYEEIKRICKDSFDVNIEQFKKMKPIFVQQQLATGEVMGGDTKSYEIELMKMGFAMDKTFGGVETLKEQMQILDSIPLEEQAQMLLESVRNIDHDNKEMHRLLQFYKEQNLDSLNALFEQGEYDLADHETSLLDNRNRKWIPTMEEYMKKGPTFFAFGAGHLGGKNGVINLLRQKGYILKAVLK